MTGVQTWLFVAIVQHFNQCTTGISSYIFSAICFLMIIWFQVFLSNTNNLQTNIFDGQRSVLDRLIKCDILDGFIRCDDNNDWQYFI